MNRRSIRLSGLFSTVAMAGLFFLALSYTSMANAAQGCGFGFHRSVYGGCIINYPGPLTTPARFYRGCWRNAWGHVRCYR